MVEACPTDIQSVFQNAIHAIDWLNEERISLDVDDKSTIHRKDKIKFVGHKGKARNAVNEVEHQHTGSRKPKLGRHVEVYAKSASAVKRPHPQLTVTKNNSNNSALKRKRSKW